MKYIVKEIHSHYKYLTVMKLSASIIPNHLLSVALIAEVVGITSDLSGVDSPFTRDPLEAGFRVHRGFVGNQVLLDTKYLNSSLQSLSFIFQGEVKIEEILYHPDKVLRFNEDLLFGIICRHHAKKV